VQQAGEKSTPVDPLRPWLPADLLDNAARTISENKTLMLGLPVVAAIGLAAVQAALTELALPGGIGRLLDDGPVGGGGSMTLVYLVQLVLFTVVSSLLSGIIALAAVRSQLGDPTPARELLRLVRPSLPALVGVGIVQALTIGVLFAGWLLAVFGTAAGFGAIAAGLALLLMLGGFVLALILGVRFVLAGTVLLMEGHKAPESRLYIPERVGVFGALRRSWRIVRGRFWRVLGTLLFGGLVLWIVSYALQFGITLLVLSLVSWAEAGGDSADVVAIATGIAAGAGTVLVMIASLAFMSALQALLYIDLRVRREGLDLWLRPAMRTPLTDPGRTP
jgi:hypothetical protein